MQQGHLPEVEITVERKVRDDFVFVSRELAITGMQLIFRSLIDDEVGGLNSVEQIRICDTRSPQADMHADARRQIGVTAYSAKMVSPEREALWFFGVKTLELGAIETTVDTNTDATNLNVTLVFPGPSRGVVGS